jgi:hypothetical protein
MHFADFVQNNILEVFFAGVLPFLEILKAQQLYADEIYCKYCVLSIVNTLT